jgi:PRC-barrel domain
MITLRDITSWPGTQLVDRYGEKLGKLQHVYVDVETDEPMFGTVKEGRMGRHLTFVPLHAITIGPDHMQVKTTKDEVKDALEIKTEKDELSQADESGLYHHYGLDYTAPAAESGRRLARR